MTDERGENGRLKSDAERLTGLGRFLRRFSLDELPQLVNVVRGEMSLVGPRPLLPEYWDIYTPYQKKRNDMLPGLTGLAQVSGRNQLSWHDKFELDIRYIEQWSFGMDLRILAKTVISIFIDRAVDANGNPTMPRFEGDFQPTEEEG